MSYYLAKSLVDLRNEINTLWPKRDKASDGWIGDASHTARKSDHNPDYSSGGVVRAIDVDKDGIDVNKLIQVLKKDPRVNYFIFNHKIYGASNFLPRRYTGSNPHTKHIHISIKTTKAAEASGSWGLSKAVSKPSPAKPSGEKWPEVKLKVTGSHTTESHNAWVKLMSDVGYKDKKLGVALQRWLKGLGYYKRNVDGNFGKYSVIALQQFLKSRNYYNGVVDGNRGPMTVKAEINYLNGQSAHY